MGMKALEHLRELLCSELEEYKTKNKLGMSDIEIVNKLTDTIKNIDKIEMLEEGDGEYSQRYSRDGNWNAHGSYDNGNSYARHYVRGHYSRDDGYGGNYSRGRYSRDDGKQEMIQQIEEMMQNANGNQREAYRRALEELRNA